MKISVALCTFNGERFLAQQLASIMDQRRVPDEIVIRDDASTDETPRIVEAFARDFPGVVDFAVNPRRLGVRGNFEAALAATTGDLILLSDQDDVWHPHRVERALQAFEADPSLLLLFADARLVDADGCPLGATLLQGLGITDAEDEGLRSGRAFEVLLKRSLALGATSCLRRSVLEDALPIPSPWMHDAWVAQIAAARGGVRCDVEPVIDYRQHGQNVEGGPPLSLRAFLAAVFSPRRDFRAHMVEHATSLARRLREIGAPPACVALVEEKLPHARVRTRLPPRRVQRVLPILREALTGRYTRFSTGWRAILIDLLGPIAPTGAGSDAPVGARTCLWDLADDIRRNCADYIRQREHWSPLMNRDERALGMRPRNLATSLLGLLTAPRRVRTDTLNVFHTVRHAGYMKAFDPRTVLLTGAAAERDLARREGYRFVWAFGAIGAVNLAVYRNLRLPLVLNLLLWRRFLRRPKRATVFLFEDTLQHGSFLVHAARGLPNGCRTVCIAHGYYPELDVPLRYEGVLCDWNFVWDAHQARLLSGPGTATQVIGLSHDARAQDAPVGTMILVGVGHPTADASVFERSMACYAQIAAIATERHGLQVRYRPHPAERGDPELLEDLRRRFGALDDVPVAARLSGPRAIFVGFVSSLLHEAGVAGHLVVHIDGHPGLHAVFERDLALRPDDVAGIDQWLAGVPQLPQPSGRGAAAGPDALGRFREALARIG